MKKYLIALAAVAVLSASQASAQNYLVNNPDNRAYFGARVGLDISSTGGGNTDVYGNGAGFTLGAIYNIPLWQNLYFEPGLHFFYNTFDDNMLVMNDNGYDHLLNGSIRNTGFRVPLNFGYRFDFTDDMSISIFTGPVLNINLTAKEFFPGMSSASLINDGFKRADLQWDFGASFQWNQYYVSLTGGAGITKVYSRADDAFRRNNFNIAVGYNF